MKYNIISLASVIVLAVGASSCTGESIDQPDNPVTGKTAMTFTFSHPSESRATDTSFENGDVVGLCAVLIAAIAIMLFIHKN